MKLCASCCRELSKGSFSNKQWQLNQCKRRCKECVHGNKDAQLTVPPKSESPEIESRQPECTVAAYEDEGASCWICLECGPDPSGGQLVRDCSCRGDSSGFSHLSCIAKYAEQKCLQWDGADEEMTHFRRAYEYCPNCHQKYNNHLAYDMAAKFVAFVEKEYPSDKLRQLESALLKMEALQNMANKLQPEQRDEAKRCGAQILSTISSVTTASPVLQRRMKLAEAVTYFSLGRVAMAEKTEDGARTAVLNFEKCCEASAELGLSHYIKVAEVCLDNVRARCEENSAVSEEATVVKMQDLYAQCLRRYGEIAPLTMAAGVDLGVILRKADRLLEAERILSRVAPICHRVHGPDHTLTIKAEANLQECSARLASTIYK